MIQVIISGFTTGLAFHPLGLGFLAWGSFVPLIHVFNISHFKKNIICGYVFGLSFNLTAFYWIGANSGADLIVPSKYPLAPPHHPQIHDTLPQSKRVVFRILP